MNRTAVVSALGLLGLAACGTSTTASPQASTPSAPVAAVASATPTPTGYQPQSPAGVAACIRAWVKIHNDGITAKVLREAGSKGNTSADQAANMTFMANMSDVTKGAVCGTLSYPDRKYATAQINAKTGDHYIAKK